MVVPLDDATLWSGNPISGNVGDDAAQVRNELEVDRLSRELAERFHWPATWSRVVSAPSSADGHRCRYRITFRSSWSEPSAERSAHTPSDEAAGAPQWPHGPNRISHSGAAWCNESPRVCGSRGAPVSTPSRPARGWLGDRGPNPSRAVGAFNRAWEPSGQRRTASPALFGAPPIHP